MKYIRFFDDIRIGDIGLVGGKNASLGEMITQLSGKGIRFPYGFAITAQAYWHYVEHNNFLDQMRSIISQLSDVHDMEKLHDVGSAVRDLLVHGTIPDDLASELVAAYALLSQRYVVDCDVAVRSSATVEDLPKASFAGQQDSFLNVCGDEALLESYKKCIASLFTDRAIIYRVEQGFDHFKVAISVGVQKMVRSDRAVAGVAFSLDTESGFKDVVMIEASYGLGEVVVKGVVNPDEYMVHKPTLAQGYRSIIKKYCGQKSVKLVYADDGTCTKTEDVSGDEQRCFCLADDEIIELAHAVVTIENYYSELKKSWSPMDVEWAKDGIDGLLYVVQARPETVYGSHSQATITQYSLKSKDATTVIVTGLSIGQKIVSGVARVITSAADIGQVQKGDIIITRMTDPDWVPVMKRAAGIITDQGGRTCHAAIVSRELGIPAIVGTGNATEKITSGMEVTIDCSRGMNGVVYDGNVPYESYTVDLGVIPKAPIPIMVTIADPSRAFELSFLPVEGVGLARMEFIVSNVIKIHPMALLHPEKIDDKKACEQIASLVGAYGDNKQFFIATLAQSIGMIAAAFYPRPVIVRFSDFKSNEYRNLIGGSFFEVSEENPMIGFRGASRYYNDRYKEAFALECFAIRHVRETMGLINLKVMIPFVRTAQEAERVSDEMSRNGLARGVNGLEVVMMCEIPSNVICIDRFSAYCDGFSIGSNDLTQLTLGVDRDSTILSQLFDERDESVQRMMKMAIVGAHAQKRHIGICGQAPSDYPEIAEFLIHEGIDSISLNADSVISFLMRYT